MKSDRLNSALSPVVHGDITPSIKFTSGSRGGGGGGGGVRGFEPPPP